MGFEKLYNLLTEHKNSKIYFWGASLFLKDFINSYNLDDFNILGIIDIDTSKTGNRFEKYQIYNADVLKNDDSAKIIFAVKNNHSTRYEVAKGIAQYVNKKVEFLPNPFKLVQNDLVFERISSNKLYLINSKNERRQVSYIPGLQVFWEGEKSIIEIGADPIPKFINVKIFCGTNAYGFIDSSIHPIKNVSLYLRGENSELKIGKNLYCNEAIITQGGERDTKIHIGDDCLFSYRVHIRSSDSHTLFEKDNPENILNDKKEVKIGDNVWICYGATVLKNSTIPSHTVIGANSLVTGDFSEENTIIAGNRAKVVKRNIDWSKKNIQQYLQDIKK